MTQTIRFILLLFLVFSFVNSQKSSTEIQKDIDKQNKELKQIRNEINSMEKQIISKTKEAISATEILIDIENKISLTEKLIRSLNREERYISEKIFHTENNINEKEKYLDELRNQLTKRMTHIYKAGRPSPLQTVVLSKNWNEAIYKVKYLEVLTDYETKIRSEISKIINELQDEKHQLESELTRKTNIKNEKQIESSNLENDKTTRKKYISKIKDQKTKLESEVKQKKEMMAQIESLINKLFSDKEASKKREEELARIRAIQNLATSGNFAKMKGKLPWPVSGKIISKFGLQRNPELKTETENSGIDIECNAGKNVVSVLDGVVSTITFIRGYGNIIIVDHGGSYSTVYAHVDEIVVRENEYVQAGKNIAQISGSGVSYLHFEVWGNQKKLNPQVWLTSK
jgi:septal ring factor EnvC (AmiA/AmiB activator)